MRHPGFSLDLGFVNHIEGGSQSGNPPDHTVTVFGLDSGAQSA